MTEQLLANLYCNFQNREVTVRFIIPTAPYRYYYEGPPPLIFICIGFNFIRTSKEKQKVILQYVNTTCLRW